jgi:hypothetical protein
MPMVDKIIEVNWYETPELGVGASQPQLKQKKCASRQEGAIFAMESRHRRKRSPVELDGGRWGAV